MTTATKAIEATDQIDDKPRWRQLLEREAEGFDVDRDELRAALWDASIDKRDYDRWLSRATDRYRASRLVLEGSRASGISSEIADRRREVDAEADAIRQQAEAKYREQIEAADRLVAEFEAENAEAVAEAKRLQERAYGAARKLERTADPAIDDRVEQLGQQIGRLERANATAWETVAAGDRAGARIPAAEKAIARQRQVDLPSLEVLDRLKHQVRAAERERIEIDRRRQKADELRAEQSDIRKEKMHWQRFAID